MKHARLRLDYGSSPGAAALRGLCDNVLSPRGIRAVLSLSPSPGQSDVELADAGPSRHESRRCRAIALRSTRSSYRRPVVAFIYGSEVRSDNDPRRSVGSRVGMTNTPKVRCSSLCRFREATPQSTECIRIMRTTRMSHFVGGRDELVTFAYGMGSWSPISLLPVAALDKYWNLLQSAEHQMRPESAVSTADGLVIQLVMRSHGRSHASQPRLPIVHIATRRATKSLRFLATCECTGASLDSLLTPSNRDWPGSRDQQIVLSPARSDC